MQKGILLFIGFFCVALWRPIVVHAEVGWGVHILSPSEIDAVIPLRPEEGRFYVTVPMNLSDRRADVWNDFFSKAEKARITPLVRWVTEFRDGTWQIPERKQMIDSVRFLSILHWSGPRHLILFNEPNRADEWGGVVEPENYALEMTFIARWLKTEKQEYVILPAGMDAAAPNGAGMLDSLAYMKRMYIAAPDLVSLVDGLTSHSYPNPGFEGSAYDTGKRSIRGFEAELSLMESFGRKDIPIYITETGWKATRFVTPRLLSYYRYAANSVWSDPRVSAVTVFLLQGTNGPFAEFSLLDPDGKPTAQMKALQGVMGVSDQD